jgi:hypothetical protein
MATILTAPMISPEPTSPLAAWTVSTRLLMVSVSPASSRLLRTVYEQVYGSPTLVGDAQPFVNPIPCWTSSAANAAPDPMLIATSIAAARLTPSRFSERMSTPSSCGADPDTNQRPGRICGCLPEVRAKQARRAALDDPALGRFPFSAHAGRGSREHG